MPDDPAEQPRGPYEMARGCRAKVVELDSAIDAAKTKAEKKSLRQRRRLCLDIVRWCETRAGYVEPTKGGA